MKIYTKNGDFGETFTADGKKISKNETRVRAYGEVDELNAVLGILRVYAHQEEFLPIFDYLQNILFVIGSDLSCESSEVKNIPRLGVNEVEKLEKWIDKMDSGLPELKNFILPGGNVVASYLHLARTVCRRAERAAVQLGKEASINGEIIRFLNRLSDLFFVMARKVNFDMNIEEKVWKQANI